VTDHLTDHLTGQLPPDVIAQLAALDSEITPQLAQASWALLTPFHEKAGYTAPKVDRDLAYGDDPRHRLDVHTAGDGADTGTGKPVFVFVHGGGFVRGDKHTPGSPQYDLVGAWAVRRGYVGVTMTYRLAPAHTWPAGAEDVATAVHWLKRNIAAYGGDPDKIVVAGNSAGAVHVASFVAGQGGGDPAGIAGAALLSGIYVIHTPKPGEPEHVYYGPDPDPAVVSSLPGLLGTTTPLLFSVAQRDPARFQQEAAGVVAAWLERHGTVPDLVWVEGHNHMSAIASLTVDEPALGSALARFIERHTSTSTTDKETAQ
jgi:predicted esterase